MKKPSLDFSTAGEPRRALHSYQGRQNLERSPWLGKSLQNLSPQSKLNPRGFNPDSAIRVRNLCFPPLLETLSISETQIAQLTNQAADRLGLSLRGKTIPLPAGARPKRLGKLPSFNKLFPSSRD